MKFASATSGQGPAEISFSVQPNRSSAPRVLEVTVLEQRATISQAAANCPWSITPSEMTINAGGGDRFVTIATEDFCSWGVSSLESWITVGPSLNGTGNAELRVRVAQNDGDERTATIHVAGGAIAVRQAAATAPPAGTPPPVEPPPGSTPGSPPPGGVPPPVGTPPVPCAYGVNPVTFTDTAPTSTALNVDVASPVGCAWTAVSRAAWITVSTGGSGSGNGRVTLAVAANSGIARSGDVLIAGRSVTVSQRGGCTYALTPASYAPTASGGNVEVKVTAGAGCTWSVTDTRTWVTASPAGGTGSAATTVTVLANSGAARSATLKIAGRDFLVTQPAAPCTYSVTPSSISVSEKERDSKITVTSQAHCPVTATEEPAVSWLSITSTPFSGSGEVMIHIEENNSSSRRTSGVTITGTGFTQRVVVSQDH